MLLALEYMRVRAVEQDVSVEFTVTLNGATGAGLGVSALFMALSVLCRVAMRGESLLQKGNAKGLILSLLGVIFGGVSLYMISHASVAVNVGSITDMSVLQMLSAVCGAADAQSMAVAIDPVPMIAVGTVLIFVRLCAVAFIALFVRELVLKETLGGKRHFLVFSCVAFGLAVLNLALGVVMGNQYLEVFDTYDVNYASSVQFLIFAALLLVIGILRHLCKGKRVG